jgi:cholesterol oxidase
LLRRLLHRLRGRRQSDASGVPRWLLGDSHAPAAMMPVLGFGRDIPNGRFVLDGDELELSWNPAPSAPYFDALRERLAQLAYELGGHFVPDPLDRRGRSIAVHPVGGCPMGDDPRHSVVDGFGRVHRHPGLWVADGSVMPGPVGVNPSFTIAAVADRTADEMLRQPRPGSSA